MKLKWLENLIILAIDKFIRLSLSITTHLQVFSQLYAWLQEVFSNKENNLAYGSSLDVLQNKTARI